MGCPFHSESSVAVKERSSALTSSFIRSVGFVGTACLSGPSWVEGSYWGQIPSQRDSAAP